jgi:hypothetical protein
MPKFDKKFVHFIWDNMLIDKMVFVGQDIEHLWSNVANLCSTVKVVYSGKIDKPFKIEDSDFCFRFVYYDPEYNKIMDEYNERLKVLHKQKDYLGLD